MNLRLIMQIALVHYRIGSLEIHGDESCIPDPVHYRIGSLEIMHNRPKKNI